MDGRHWPGGIPSTIRPHPEQQDSGFNFNVVTQGFRRFIRQNWKLPNNEDDEGFEYEIIQRREELMERIEEVAPVYLEAEEEGAGFAANFRIIIIV
ncbi:hypothetical protein N7513_006648 [Penicillium frequentans]|nr:hypothetical protein N7513_006648 [Penicillium glabrum]